MTSLETDILHAKEAAQRERSLRTLADNVRWLDEHRGQTVHPQASTLQSELTQQASEPKIEAHGAATCSSACRAGEPAQPAEQGQQ